MFNPFYLIIGVSHKLWRALLWRAFLIPTPEIAAARREREEAHGSFTIFEG